MSVRVMSAVWDMKLPPMEKLVLLALADCANDEGRCWPSATTLARKTGEGERTVRRAIQSLMAKGFLDQQLRTGTSPIYTINPCQSGTPARAAPLPDRPGTPARAAPKPLGTVNSSEAKASSLKPATFILPADIPAEPWDAFLEMRRKLRKPVSDHAKHLAVLRLRKLRDEDGWPPGDVLNNSTLNSYQGLFPPKDRDNGRQQQSNPRQSNPTLDLLRAANAEIAQSASGQDHCGAWLAVSPPIGR